MAKYDIVGKYQRLELIGQGSFGKVFSGRNLKTDKICAIKQISKARITNAKERQALQREISIMRPLNHENIVKLYDYFETTRCNYLVLEYCSGGDLKNRKQIGEAQSVIFLRQILNALKVLQKNNIVHRDLKPDNILLSDKSPDAVCKLTDFGLARQVDSRVLCSTYVGTPLYMAPEVIEGRQGFREKADIWSVGVIAYELITGDRPFEAMTMEELKSIIYRKLNNLSWVENMSVSPSCKDFFRRVFQRNPDKRITFNEMCKHPFLLGHLNIEPALSLQGLESLHNQQKLLSMDQTFEIATTYYDLAETIDHPFLFYLRCCQILKDWLIQNNSENARLIELFQSSFLKAQEYKIQEEWKYHTVTKLAIQKAVQLCQGRIHNRDNLKSALNLLGGLKSNEKIMELKLQLMKYILD